MKTGYRGWDYWFLLGVWVIAGLSVLAEKSEAGDLPTAAEKGFYQRTQDCNVFVTVRGRAKERLEALVADLKEAKELARERKGALESCGANQGIPFRSLQDRLLVEKCEEPFQGWLGAGETFEVLRSEVDQVSEDLGALNRLIAFQCGLPGEKVAIPISE